MLTQNEQEVILYGILGLGLFLFVFSYYRSPTDEIPAAEISTQYSLQIPIAGECEPVDDAHIQLATIDVIGTAIVVPNNVV